MTMEPKPQTIALTGADAEYAQTVLAGARETIQRLGLKIVYDRSYPPSTVDYSPIVRSIQATNPDVVFVASYPPDSVGIVRAINEIGLSPKMLGGGMIGLAFTPIKQQLGPAAQRHRRLRRLCAGTDDEIPRYRRLPQEISGKVCRGRRRSARALSSALCLCGNAGPGPGNDRGRQHRSCQDRRLYPRHEIQHYRGRREVRGQRRVGEGAGAIRAISECQGQRRQPVPSSRHPGDSLPAGAQI